MYNLESVETFNDLPIFIFNGGCYPCYFYNDIMIECGLDVLIIDDVVR